jgi:hypothetical protein
VLVKIMGGRGTGGGAGPINYLLGENRNRDGARLLRGDADRTAMLIDSLKFRQKYVSGVLSFEESDIPEDQKQAIMDSFQQALLPDMNERTNWLWVEHNDKNRLELNFVIPTVDLETGKRVQPYYHRADLNRVDAWKSLTNDVYRFTDPNDPAKRQTLTLKTNESSDRKSLKRVINEYASVLFANGVVNNRRELVDAIHQHGFNPTRMTKNSVTFTHPETNQKFRMTGAFYEESFRSRGAFQTADRGRNSESEQDRKQRIEQNRKRLNRAVSIKRAEIGRRYFRESSKDIRPAQPEQERDQLNVSLHATTINYRSDFADVSSNRVEPIHERLGVYRSVSGIADRDLRVWSLDVRDWHFHRREWQGVSESKNNNQPEPVDDRIRENVARCVAETHESVQRIRASNGRRLKEYKALDEQGIRETERAIGRIREIGQQHGRFAQKSTERAREFVERAEKNNRAIEPTHRRHQHLLESVRDRVTAQRRGRSRSVYPRR